MRKLLPIVIGVAGLACTVAAVYLIVSLAAALSYMDDDYCTTRSGPSAIQEEGTSSTEKSSIVPPSKTCIYDTPSHGRIVIEHRPF